VKDLFGDEMKTIPITEPNPCVKLYGYDPDGRLCQYCKHLWYKQRSKHSTRHYKCELRKLTSGPGSDHRVRWKACGKYEPVA